MTKLAVSPDDVCAAFAASGAKLSIRDLEGLVLIEGTEDALLRFAELIVAQARFCGDDGFEISPNGPGSLIFDSKSTLGVYIHVLRSSSDRRVDPTSHED